MALLLIRGRLLSGEFTDNNHMNGKKVDCDSLSI